MKTPVKSEKRQLRRRLGGYDTRAVDCLLAELSLAHDDLWQECSVLRSQGERLEHERAQSEKLERRLRETLVSAQQATEEMRRRATSETAGLLAAVRPEAEEGRARTAAEFDLVTGRIDRMRKLERELRSQIRVLVEDALHRLGDDMIDDAPGNEETVSPQAELRPAAVEAAASPAGRPEEAPTGSLPVAPIGESAPEPEADRSWKQPFAKVRWLVLFAAILLAGAAVGVWQLTFVGGSASNNTPAAPRTEAGTTASNSGEPPSSEATNQRPAPVKIAETSPVKVAETSPPKAKLVLRATRGDCWVLVRSSSANGKILYEGFLLKGATRRFVSKRLWVRLGAPSHLTVTLNGRPVENLPSGTADVVVTAERFRTVSLG